jgi:hypothetical protein
MITYPFSELPIVADNLLAMPEFKYSTSTKKTTTISQRKRRKAIRHCPQLLRGKYKKHCKK